MNEFEKNKARVIAKYEELITRRNVVSDTYNGIYDRYENPVLTAAHAPVIWRYDMNPATNPHFMERLGINAVLNSGAIFLNGKYYLVARVEGNDRKSFFAVAESDSPVDNFRFWDFPVRLPDTEPDETNVYDMRLTQHEDGWIYGVFCSESKDKTSSDLSAATAQAGIVRTKDLKHGRDFPTSSPSLLSREMLCFTLSLLTASMLSIPVPRTTLSRQAQAEEYASVSARISQTLLSAQMRSLSLPDSTTPSPRSRTVQALCPLRPPRAGYTLHTA